MKKLLLISIILAATVLTGCTFNPTTTKVNNGIIQYKMECYIQNIENNEYTLDRNLSKTYDDVVGKKTEVSPVDLQGFTKKSFTQETIEADYSTTVKNYYDRNFYKIYFDTDGANPISPLSVKYQATVTEPITPVKAGYSFLEWNPELPKEMPANDFNTKAIWNNASYNISYYGEYAFYDC